MVAETSVTHPTVGVGVLDDPCVATLCGDGWLLKRASTDVGEGVLTLPLAVRREILVRMGGWYNPRFRKPARKGGRGRPPLQRDLSGCEIYAYRRAYRHTRYDARWLSLYIRFSSSGYGGGERDASSSMQRHIKPHCTQTIYSPVYIITYICATVNRKLIFFPRASPSTAPDFSLAFRKIK